MIVHDKGAQTSFEAAVQREVARVRAEKVSEIDYSGDEFDGAGGVRADEVP